MPRHSRVQATSLARQYTIRVTKWYRILSKFGFAAIPTPEWHLKIAENETGVLAAISG